MLNKDGFVVFDLVGLMDVSVFQGDITKIWYFIPFCELSDQNHT